MRLIPTRKQWNEWSLPSKLTAIGAYVGIIGLVLGVVFFVISVVSRPQQAKDLQQGFSETVDSVGERDSSSDDVLTDSISALSLPRLSSITFNEFVATYDSLYTRSRFLEVYELERDLDGTQVTWEGYVVDVGEYGDSSFVIVTITEESHRGFPLVDVRYDRSWRAKLYSLHKGDKVRVTGVLHSQGGGGAALTGSELEVVNLAN